MSTTTDGDLPQPRALPIRPRPMPGEEAHAYLRRLARSNHLRPAYLRRYLKDPDGSHQPRLDWLAVLAGRSQADLRRAFTALPAAATHRSRRHQSAISTRRTNAKRALFTAIRSDAHRSGWSIRALADRHGVHRRTVQRALRSPIPPPRKQQRARGSRLDPFKQVIETILQADHGGRYAGRLSIQSIHTTLVNEHGMTGVSYSRLRDYITNHCRPLANPSPPPEQANPTTPAHEAVEQHDLAFLRDLLHAGHDVEDDNGDGWTLLRHAIAAEHDSHRRTGEPAHADLTAFLLARGADPQRPGPDGTTPLHEAETRGHWLAAEIIHAWTNRARHPPPLPFRRD